MSSYKETERQRHYLAFLSMERQDSFSMPMTYLFNKYFTSEQIQLFTNHLNTNLFIYFLVWANPNHCAYKLWLIF